MTQRIIAVGKYRALQRTSTPSGHFAILAMDHQDALRRVMNSAAPETITTEQIVTFKAQVVRALAPETSGVLLDPIYGAAQAVSGGYLRDTALLVELEHADYQLKPIPLESELLPDWSVAKIKRMGADGVKLFFYYNPDDEALTARQDVMLRRLVSECAAYDIPFYAEPIICAIGEDHATYGQHFSRRVTESARRVAALGADVLKLEFPVPSSLLHDEALCRSACEDLTASVDTPWVLLSAGVSFEAFCRQVEFACAAGASGFMAGRAVWGEAAQIADETERQTWLETTGRERLRQLAAHVGNGRPWMDVLHCERVTTEWYQRYRE